MPTRILIADDHAVFRSGLRALLEKNTDFMVAGEVGTGVAAVKLAAEIAFDVLLLDINMPEMNGAGAAEEILKQKPDTAIIVLTMHDDEHYLQEFFKIGVKGFVLKNSTGTDLIQAIRAVSRGEQYVDPSMAKYLICPYVGRRSENAQDTAGRKSKLTPREREVCRLLAYGHTNSEIGEKLFISERTVETHRSHIFEKLGISNRAELVRFAIDNGLMDTK